MKLTVFWDGQFWIGIVEDDSGGRLKACRHLFGAEPHDAEVLDFIRLRMNDLLEHTRSSLATGEIGRKRINPKRLARMAASEMKRRGVSTQAEEAIRLELEQRKKTSRQQSRQQREEEARRKREIAVQKAKAKHRGR
ncbi:YjdF family protein [Paenibacillus hodogayensis]|uniref:YjdF family protein n=1 Tax=Paenibacillus hodogayensis TaxID=279208 RepID=A0ABV5VY33_9BACL